MYPRSIQAAWRLVLAVLGVIAVCLSACSSPPAETTTRSVRLKVFSDHSFWYQPLPDSTPRDPQSAAIMRDLLVIAARPPGAPGRPHVGLNTRAYSPTVYVSTNADPLAKFVWSNCYGLSHDGGLIRTQLDNVRIPYGAKPALGNDSEMVIYNEDTDEYTDIAKAEKNRDGTWSACYGATIRHARTDDGVFTPPFTATATGLPFLGGLIRYEELADGEIDHVIGIAIPFAKAGVVSWPATRGDGKNPNGMTVPAQGQRLRLPASVDVDAMRLSPTARAIARAAQRYGFVIWDTAAVISLRAENLHGLAHDPYPELFRRRSANLEMFGDLDRGERSFPVELLEVLPMNYRVPVTGGGH